MRPARESRPARQPRVFLAAILAAGGAAGGCASTTRDVVPETHDVHVTAGPGTGTGVYAHVARRPLGFVALARQTGLGDEIGAGAAEHLADALDACATTLAAKGRLVDGTIRIDANVAADGSVSMGHVTVAPGDSVAANALLCVVAPLKLTTFPPATGATARGFTIDASWGPPQTAPIGHPRPSPPSPLSHEGRGGE